MVRWKDLGFYAEPECRSWAGHDEMMRDEQSHGRKILDSCVDVSLQNAWSA